MPSDELFTREEALGGLPAKRAATLIFLIESRTAHLVDQSRRAMEFFLTEESAKDRDLAFLEAFSLGREPPLRPTIQDLERYAPQWVPLVPDNPSVQAAVAHLFGQTYEFTYPAVPRIRAALGLDEEPVQREYRLLYREPLETIYAARPTLAERLQWAWAAVAGWPDLLPPFWTACVLTLAFSLPQAMLALPIAVARVGPLSGLLVLAVIGFFNVLTMAAMAEACARSGSIRYGRAFVGRLVTDFLGSTGSFIFSLALAIRTFLLLLAACFGMAITLMTFTEVRGEVWIMLLFVFELYLLSRKTLKITVTTLVLLAAVNIGLLLPIAVLGFMHLQMQNLLPARVPLFGGESFDPDVLQLVFGVILLLYFGHVYVVHCAKIVLARDPTARSLIRGTVAGTAALTAIVAIWLLAVGGAIAPHALAAQTGTVLTPLAEQLGSITNVLGPILIIFFLGMAIIRCSNVLFNLIYERLPTRLQSIVMLPRRRGSLLLHRRGASWSSPRLGLTYLGLTDGHPQFRFDLQLNGNTHQAEIAVPGHCDVAALLDRLPEPRPSGISLMLETVEARPESVRLRVTSAMSLSYEGDWDTAGLRMADALTLPDPLQALVSWMMRREEVTLADVTAYTGKDEDVARTMLDDLVEQDFIHVMEAKDGPRYQVRLGSKRGREVSPEIWQALDAKVDAPASSDRVPSPTARPRVLP